MHRFCHLEVLVLCTLWPIWKDILRQRTLLAASLYSTFASCTSLLATVFQFDLAHGSVVHPKYKYDVLFIGHNILREGILNLWIREMS